MPFDKRPQNHNIDLCQKIYQYLGEHPEGTGMAAMASALGVKASTIRSALVSMDAYNLPLCEDDSKYFQAPAVESWE